MTRSFPLVFSYRKREQDLVEKKRQPTAILFLDTEDTDTPEERGFRQAAHDRKGHIHFTKLNKKLPTERDTFYRNKFDSRFGVRKFPAVFIYDTASPLKYLIPNHSNRDRYKLDGPITPDTVAHFIDQWKAHQLEPYYKSQPIPPINDGLVKIIVGKSYQAEVINSDKPFLLFFHDPYNSVS